MLEPPFELLSCSWPRPVQQENGNWTSEPDWDAPPMPNLPRFNLEVRGPDIFWRVDWRDFFRQGVRLWHPYMGGEMAGFHIVFKLRMKESGSLVFWDDDSSIIRRGGKIIHQDRAAHDLTRHELAVKEGDVLEVAQWQFGWDWLWLAQVYPVYHLQPVSAESLLEPYLERITQALARPDGPPLKMYTNGATPYRVIVAIYSLVLRGYVPDGIYLFGSEQWNDNAFQLFKKYLPFAETVPEELIQRTLQTYGGSRLTALAQRYWFVMKTCVGLLYSPDEACLLDDDVFILDDLAEALQAFRTHDLVFSPDQDLRQGYAGTWPGLIKTPADLRTNRFNAGLYWVRNNFDKRWLAEQMLRVVPNPNVPFLWEQGFIAAVFARRATLELPRQRYLFPLFDGLPGGIAGYDYATNPCGFASIHYGGLAEKPSDGLALQLLPALVNRAVFTDRDSLTLPLT